MTKEEKREYMKQYNKQYYQANREQYKEFMRKWRQENAEKIKEYNKQYRKDNKERLKEYDKQYNKTPMGRALYLLNRYNRSDKEYNRGKGDLTAQWIVERIFSQPCAHCGKEGWEVIGCNRLDNSLPHTMDNVEPCCFDCNRKIG